MPKTNRYHPKIKEIISLNNLAIEYSSKNDLHNAYEVCMKILELEPAPDMLRQSIDLGIKHMRYHMILSDIYYRNGNYPEAIKILNSLKSLGKFFSDKYILLAKIHLKDDDYAKALKEYEEMIVECPQRFKSILNGLLEIINLDPFTERSYELLHDLYKKRGKEASLIPEFERRIEEDEHNRQRLLGTLEHLYCLMGQAVHAIPLLIQHQKRYPNDAKSYYLLGNIYLESGKYAEAMIQYNQLIKLDPSKKSYIISSIERVPDYKDIDIDITNYLINLYVEQKSFAQAEKMLDHLLETKPDIAKYQDKMEQVLSRIIKGSFQGNSLDFCILKAEKLIKLKPENTKYKQMLKKVQNINTRKKITEYEKKLKAENLSENEANGLNFDLAMHYINAGTNEERAMSLFQKVTKSSSSKKAESLLQVGFNFLNKGHNDIAYDNFNNILALYVPTREKLNYLYRIAIACEKHNVPTKAKYYYGKILSIDLQYKDVTERMERISVLTNSAASETLMTNINQKFSDIKKIGEGNMWFFYKAVDKLLKRKVMITIIKEDFRYNPEAIDHFIKDISKAQHNGIVKVYDVNIDILLYIVFEYIDGESLRSIKKKRSFKWKEVLKIAIDTCDAIKCAHKHGVIHRDIRPDNIRLTGDNTVKISAFGLAHIANAPELNNVDQTAEIPFYKSPEQIRGIEEEIDERSDIYSLGITLYELLTGHLPFHDGDIADQHINMPPESLSKENPEIPKWLDSIVLKCLEKSPSDRYQEMGHLQKMLESHAKFYLDQSR